MVRTSLDILIFVLHLPVRTHMAWIGWRMQTEPLSGPGILFCPVLVLPDFGDIRVTNNTSDRRLELGPTSEAILSGNSYGLDRMVGILRLIMPRL